MNGRDVQQRRPDFLELTGSLVLATLYLEIASPTNTI